MKPSEQAKGTGWLVGALLVAFPALKLLTHLLAGGDGYGYHRDELYYLACARHLDWGYVDHPPLSILILRIASTFLGEGVRAIRLVPALAGAATVLVVGLLARRLGGGPFAMALAMASALVAPVYLALDQYYSMNALDLLVWSLSAYLFVVVLRDGRSATWLLLGVVLGIGLQNKLSVLWLMFGLSLGLLLTPQRRLLRTRWPWLTLAVALIVFLPHVFWQVHHGWPTLEFIHNATTQKLVSKAIRTFVLESAGSMLIVAAPVWMAGLVFFLLLPAGRGLRALGWAYLAVFSVLALSRTSRDYYLAAAFTWLLAAGGVAIEGWLGRLGRLGRWAGPPLVGLLLLFGPIVAPVVLPILPPAAAARYSRGMGGRPQEKTGLGPLPEFLAHMSGWEEIVATVAEAYTALPAEERSRAAILAPNYGVAGAIDRLGTPYGMPPAWSGHNNYWLWGPHDREGDPLIVIGRSEVELRQWFTEVTRVGETQCAYCMPYENGLPVWVARQPRAPLRELWIQFKRFE